MRTVLITGIEQAIKQIARQNMSREEFAHFEHQLGLTKRVRLGSTDATVFDWITHEATAIAD